MVETVTTVAKYVFFDVVGFTHNRNVEAQSEIVAALNVIAKKAVSSLGIDSEKVIYIPTGDGMCIALTDVVNPYDVHVTLALSLLELVSQESLEARSPDRKFQIRIGVNENTDNLVIDVNSTPNVAGAGISEAARIMDVADGSNILVGQVVYDNLRQRERYEERFRRYVAKVKHDITLPVFQLIDPECSYLNSETPSAFVAQVPPVPKLSLTTAYLIGYLIKYYDVIPSYIGSGLNDYALFVVMAGVARVRVAEIEATRMNPHDPVLDPLPSRLDFDNVGIQVSEEYPRDIGVLHSYYMKIDFNLVLETGEYFQLRHIRDAGLRNFFDLAENSNYLAVSAHGEKVLRESWPAVVKDLDI